MNLRIVAWALGGTLGQGSCPVWAAAEEGVVAERPGRPVGEAAAEVLACLHSRVLYRERIALAPDARLAVRLVDVSRADAPATVVSEARFLVAGQPPIPFEIAYDPRAIRENCRYAVELELTSDGRRWSNTTSLGVLTQGAEGLPDEILLQRVP